MEILYDHYIPDYILLPESETVKGCHVPSCPVIVFINTKSGGQLGGELLHAYCSLLNRNQVDFFYLRVSVVWQLKSMEELPKEMQRNIFT